MLLHRDAGSEQGPVPVGALFHPLTNSMMGEGSVCPLPQIDTVDHVRFLFDRVSSIAGERLGAEGAPPPPALISMCESGMGLLNLRWVRRQERSVEDAAAAQFYSRCACPHTQPRPLLPIRCPTPAGKSLRRLWSSAACCGLRPASLGATTSAHRWA